MAQMTIDQACQLAAQHHRAGHLAEAEALCRQILAFQPGHAAASHLLAAILFQAGTMLHPAGRLDEAAAAYQQAVALKPDFPEAYANLGAVLNQQGRRQEAVAAYDEAIALRPSFPEVWSNLGETLRELGKVEEAEAACRKAIELRPKFPEAHNNLGIALARQGRWKEAIDAYHKALSLRSNSPAAWNNLGDALCQTGKLEDAADAIRRAIALRPDFAEAHSNLGQVLTHQGHSDAALDEYRTALDLRPDLFEVHSNIGYTQIARADYDAAAAAFRRALEQRPDYPEARFGLAWMLLLSGEEHGMAEGWEMYESRSGVRAFAGTFNRRFTGPAWDGGDLAGRRILVHWEQGLGDTIQFMRYAPLVARGGTVLVQCQRQLTTLLRGQVSRGGRYAGIAAVSDDVADLGPYDRHVSMLSLPRIFGTMLQTIPADVPYLTADPALAESWRARISRNEEPVLGAEDGGAGAPTQQLLRVGLVWAGNPDNKTDRLRSISLSALAPLVAVPGVRFYSLQKGPAAAQAKSPPAGMDLVDWTDELKDFADTAAMVANLDLVVSVDTSVAHLAGAMGKPVWVLLPSAPDFRWMLDRTDSPWYPTMRLFRQPKFADWDTPLKQMAEAMADFAADRAGSNR